MDRKNIKKTLLFFIVGVAASGLVLYSFYNLAGVESIEYSPFAKELRTFLIKRLVRADSMPREAFESAPKSDTVIYMLGGSQKSLRYKFKTAVGLYQGGVGGKILILSRSGITEYDPVIKRNLTNDEWAVRELLGLGVNKEDIEFVNLQEGLLGTFTEAKGVFAVASSKRYRQLTLVSSPHHTARIRAIFFRFVGDSGIKLYIVASTEYANLKNLILEYLKLLVYKYIIIPGYGSIVPRFSSH